jgi:hypothetical protein
MKNCKRLLQSVKNMRDVWLKEPVGNTPEWHAVVLTVIQEFDLLQVSQEVEKES